jgi:hypothetical protein
MKKFLVGCLILVLFCVVVLGIGGFFLWRAASPVIDNARNYLQGLSQLGELEKEIKNQAPYTPPASGELTEAQVQRFVRVQDSVRASLGQRMTEIEEKYKHLQPNNDAGQQPSMSEVIAGLSDLGNAFLQARRYQVNALNSEGFSQEEYSWVRDRVFQAAGVEVSSMVDLQKLEDAVRQGTGVESIGVDRIPKPNVPEKNRALIKPHMSKVDEWIPLAFFGL